MHRISTCLFLVMALVFQTCQTAWSAPNAPATTPPSKTLSRGLMTLRSAVKSGAVAIKIHGDGSSTRTVVMRIDNKTDHELRLVIPANEVLLSKNPLVQNMMVTRDAMVTVPKKTGPNDAVEVDLATMCVSFKTVAPPGAEEADVEVGGLPDQQKWKDVASIVQAARALDGEGAFGSVIMDPAKKVSEIAQLAVWFFLGKDSSNPKDKVTTEVINSDLMLALGDKKKNDLTKEQKQGIDKNIENIFMAVDLTVKRAKTDEKVRELATLPTDSPFDTFLTVGNRALADGNLIEADELLSSALDEAEALRMTGAPMANALSKLAMCFLYQGKAAKAEPLFKRAVEVAEKTFGPDSTATVEALTGLAQSMLIVSKAPEAIPFFERVLQIQEKAQGSKTPAVADAANNLGVAYTAVNREAEAEQAFSRALAIRISTAGMESMGVSEIDKNLADLYTKEGKTDRAQKLYERALQIVEKVKGNDDDPAVCTILDGLSQLCKGARRAADADKFAEISEQLKEKLLGASAALMTAVPAGYAYVQRLAISNAPDKKIGLVARATAALASTDATPNRPVRDKWAIVVGISDFSTRDINLKYSAKDAKDFADFLIKEQGFKPDHVHLLVNEQATRQKIISEILDHWLPYAARPDDLVVIYMSSHGSPSFADSHAANYLVAYDTDKKELRSTGIDMASLGEEIKTRVKSDRVVMFLDACNSGAVEAGSGRKDLVRASNFDPEQLVMGVGQAVICSSRANQSSWESKKYPNGIFTHHLIESLRKEGGKTIIDDAWMSDFSKRVCDEAISEWGEKQEPVIKNRWRGSRLMLGVPVTDPVTVTK